MEAVSAEFDAAYTRLCRVFGMQLAHCLGIRQSTISDAKRRARIPDSWLVTALTQRAVNPAWIKTGEGPRYIVISEKSALPPLKEYSVDALFAELSRRFRLVMNQNPAEDA